MARVANGGARSELWRQVTADVLGIPLEQTARHPGSSLGVAFVAGMGVGAFDDWREIERYMEVAGVTEPDMANHDRYRRLYALYREVYTAAEGEVSAAGPCRWRRGMRLKGKVAAVTGAGSGIGRAIAVALAAEGARVAVTDVDSQSARRVAQEIVASGGDAVALKLDVTRRRDAEAATKRLLERWGRIDIWCNNAGVSTMARFWDVADEEWELNMDVNARGVFICSQVVARQMMDQEPDPASGLQGKIIVTASMAGRRGNAPFLSPYVASKFAVVGLTQAMSGELAPKGITVNAVCPGYVETPMHERELRWEAELRGGHDRRRAPALYRRHPAGATGDAGGRGEGRPLPRLAGRRLHHRPGAQHQRRRVDGVTV